MPTYARAGNKIKIIYSSEYQHVVCGGKNKMYRQRGLLISILIRTFLRDHAWFRLFRVLGWCEWLIWVSDVLIYLTAIWSTIFEWFCPLSFYSNWKCPQQNTRPWWRSRRMITHWRVVANFTGVLAKVLRASIRIGWYALRTSIRSLLVCEKVLYWIRQSMQEQKKNKTKNKRTKKLTLSDVKRSLPSNVYKYHTKT